MENGGGVYYKSLVPKITDLVRQDLTDTPVDDIRLPFIDILRFLEAGGRDMHFKGPYESNCNPCMLKYDYLGKVETFDHDMNYIIDHQFPLKRGKNTKRNSNLDTKTSSVFYKELKEYKHISPLLVKVAMIKYGRDFHQFGYKTDLNGGDYFATCTGSCC